MKIIKRFKTYFLLTNYSDAKRLCIIAEKLGLKFDTLPRNDGKPIFIEYPGVTGGLSWSYRYITENGCLEASKIKDAPESFTMPISLDDDNYLFDVIEGRRVNLEEIERIMLHDSTSVNQTQTDKLREI